MARNHMTDNDGLFTATVADPALDDLHTIGFHHLLGGSMGRDGLIQVLEPPVRRREYQGETPVEGRGAVARWVALHDRVGELRSALQPGDVVGERQVRRAIRSLFLYEHQLTPTTRRQARTFLWRRDRADEPLALFLARVDWSHCRCVRCQPRTASEAEAGGVGVSAAMHEGIVLQSA